MTRGEPSLSCYTCGDKLIVKDGEARRKHFSHARNSKCHGEGPAHYRLKMAIRDVLHSAIERRGKPEARPIFLHYPCPESEYAFSCSIKCAPPVLEGESATRAFDSMRDGYHSLQLTDNLHEVRHEAWLNNRRTRADLAGFGSNETLLWVIEIKRGNLSEAALESAKSTGVPVLVIDISDIPKSPHDDPYAEDEALWLVWENLRNGILPRANTESKNTLCPRKESGAGPEDSHGTRVWGITESGNKILLHECASELCPDRLYIFCNNINEFEMYTSMVHSPNSHNPIPVSADACQQVVRIKQYHFTQATT